MSWGATKKGRRRRKDEGEGAAPSGRNLTNKELAGFRQDNPASFLYFLNSIAHINLELVHESKSDGGIDTHFPFFVVFCLSIEPPPASRLTYTRTSNQEKKEVTGLSFHHGRFPLTFPLPCLSSWSERKRVRERELWPTKKSLQYRIPSLCWSVGRNRKMRERETTEENETLLNERRKLTRRLRKRRNQ